MRRSSLYDYPDIHTKKASKILLAYKFNIFIGRACRNLSHVLAIHGDLDELQTKREENVK